MPQLISINEAVEYLRQKHGMETSRQTLHNWMNRGRCHTCLPYVTRDRSRFVTRGAIDAFVRDYVGPRPKS